MAIDNTCYAGREAILVKRGVKQLTNKSQDRPTAAPMYPTSLNPAGITINAIPI